MKFTELISIVIPLYNASKYISSCLDSVLLQSYVNFEVIIIDDGSTDDSYEIASKYAQRDNRIKLYAKENEGVSVTRNKGIGLSNGKYICFVDSDDIIDKCFLEKLIAALKMEPTASIAIAKIKFIYESELYSDGNLLLNTKRKQRKKDIFIEANEDYSFNRKVQHLSACAALYKKSSISNIRFDSNLIIGEDALFHNQVFVSSKRAIIIDEYLYFYVMHSDSAFKSPYSPKKLTELIAWKKIVELYKFSPKAHKSARGEYGIRCVNIYKQLCLSSMYDKTQSDYLINEIKKNFIYSLYCGCSIKEIFISLFSIISPKLFKLVYCRNRL